MLTPWKESYDQPRQHIQKLRHYFFNKGPSSQGYGFSCGHVWMWELDCEEGWGPKNWCFVLWCWRWLFRVHWTARRSNQSILKEISPGISLEGMMLKLKLQYFGHLSSVQFSHSVVSDSLQPHESQLARPPCPSPTPGVHSNPHPLSWWCHPAISSSVVPFSSCPQSLPASESFPMSQLFAWGGQSTGTSALASFPPKNTQGWSPSEWTGWISLQSKGVSGVFSNTTVQKHQFFSAQLSSQSNSHIHTWPQENHSLG